MSTSTYTASKDRTSLARPLFMRAARHSAEWLALGSVLFASSGQLLIKFGLNAHAAHPALFTAYWPALLGLCVYGLGTMLWIAAVSRADISYIFPLSAISYTLVALGSQALLGEHFRAGRWVGIAILTMGVALLFASKTEKTDTGSREAA